MPARREDPPSRLRLPNRFLRSRLLELFFVELKEIWSELLDLLQGIHITHFDTHTMREVWGGVERGYIQLFFLRREGI